MTELYADRRTLLRGAAALGVTAAAAGALAACGGDDSPSSSGGGAPSGAGAGTRPTGEIAKTSDVPVGGGKIVNADGSKIVVTQPVANEFKAFSAVCTHQGCTVNSVEGDVIHCPCHGSEFSASTGAVTKGPATAPLASVPVSVTDGTVSFA